MASEPSLPEQNQEPEPGTSAYLLQEMQLYGYRPFEDEPDQRPLPDDRHADRAIADIFDAMVSCLIDTRVEPDLEDLLWHITNVFQRASERIDRELDTNELAQKRLQREQDGSEVKSVDLERKIAEGISMIERRNTMEYFRDAAAEQFDKHLRKTWLPRSGPMVNRKKLTSAVLDSRRQIDKRAWEDARVLNPDGPRIAVSAGPKYDDYRHICSVMDKLHAHFPDMVVVHGGTDSGGELIVARWCRNNDVPQDPRKPNWEKHGKAAPFKRNDAILETMPKGLVVFPGTGIQGNIADKARKMGICVWDFRDRRSE
jgi:hypothetical protein